MLVERSMSDLSLEVKAELVRQLSMQGVVFKTWCGENSTHPLSCIVASTRRGTTTDLRLPDVREKTWLKMSGPRRASPRTPCGDCWACLDWPMAKVERSKS